MSLSYMHTPPPLSPIKQLSQPVPAPVEQVLAPVEQVSRPVLARPRRAPPFPQLRTPHYLQFDYTQQEPRPQTAEERDSKWIPTGRAPDRSTSGVSFR